MLIREANEIFEDINFLQNNRNVRIKSKVLCEKYSVKPLTAVQAYLQEDCLRFCVDYVKLKDWPPILNSLAENRSVSKLYIYSRSGCKKIRESINTEEKLEQLRRCRTKARSWPILYTNFLLRCLVDSVAVSARDSATVTSITFDGIPLAPKYVNILCSGLKNNRNLMHLSLAKCRIGDNGCDLLLGCLRNCSKLRALNLSSCRLTNRSARYLSLFLKRRRADLLQDVWEESSLKSHDENYQKEGLYTLILNKNPKFGDVGVRQLTYALKSDFWLKSLSLRNCGITKQGGQVVLELLQSSCGLESMDLAGNYVPVSILQTILRTLKRKRDVTESILAKGRLQNWKNHCSRNIFKGRRRHSPLSLSDKRLINQTMKRGTMMLQNQYKKSISRFAEKAGGKEIRASKKDNAFERSDLCDLESQLSNIISSNSMLKEEISNNVALIEIEMKERSRTENELQKISARLSDLKSKVIKYNQFHSKFTGGSHLQEILRQVSDKLEAFSEKRRRNEQDNEMKDASRDGEVN